LKYQSEDDARAGVDALKQQGFRELERRNGRGGIWLMGEEEWAAVLQVPPLLSEARQWVAAPAAFPEAGYQQEGEKVE
jgi:hypothetical protein